MRNSAMLSLALAAASAPALAQTASQPDGAWRGSLGAGVSQATGSVDTFTATANADAVRRTERDKLRFYFQSLYSRQETNGVTELNAQQVRLGGRYDRDFSDLSFGFAGYDGEKNKVADLKWRHVPAIGAGVHLRNSKDFQFDVFGGYAYNREIHYSSPDRSFNEALIGEETTSKFTKNMTLTQKLQVYPNLTDRGEYRVTFDAGFVAPLFARWNLTVTYSLRYQSNPPPGIENRDTLLFTGLQYQWGPQ
jgi:putative salt-induced outer membrane protein